MIVNEIIKVYCEGEDLGVWDKMLYNFPQITDDANVKVSGLVCHYIFVWKLDLDLKLGLCEVDLFTLLH